MLINGTYSTCFMDELFSHCMEKVLLAVEIPHRTKREAWLDSWLLALFSLLDILGPKLELQPQIKDEKVTENLREFVERVKCGLVAQLKVSI